MGLLPQSAKHSANAVLIRFFVGPRYHSDRAGPFKTKRGTPIIKISKLAIYNRVRDIYFIAYNICERVLSFANIVPSVFTLFLITSTFIIGFLFRALFHFHHKRTQH